jgi:thioredoxin reductase
MLPYVPPGSKRAFSLYILPFSKLSRVAIVGAGFAGLTLANYLSTHRWPCVESLDAKSEPIPIIGTIRLPHAKKVVEEVLALQGIPPSNKTLLFEHGKYCTFQTLW